MAVIAVLALSVATEMDAALNLGQKQRLAFVWGILNGYYGHSKELWDSRYEKLCAGSAA